MLFRSDLKTGIAFYEKLLFDESSKRNADQAKMSLWNSRMFELSRRHDSLIGVIEKDYPAYYNMKYDNSVTSMKEAGRKLTGKQALVEYTLSDSLLYIFVITHTDLRLFVSPIRKSFFRDLKTIREMLAGRSFNNYSAEDFKVFTTASFNLYNTLLEPANSLISGKDLIVVPDAELGYLSFDILLTEEPGPNARGYRGLPYLLKKVPVSYAPSATALFEGFRNQQQHRNHKVLAFAPSYSMGEARPNSAEQGGFPGKTILGPIPGAQTEVQNLKSILKSDIYDGEDATESNFKKIAGNYSLLHLAMHTLINNDNPLYSKLVFYQNHESSEDGMLNTYELFGMQLNADLAVLSACNTGSGKLEQGEGVMSLARGFFYAGVPSIVMTSWAVEDQPGAGIMTSFYKYLSQGKSKNVALQQAKLDYLESADQLKSHPHYWAAYMNIGDINPVQNLESPFPRSVTLIIYLLSALMAAGIILLIRRKLKRAGKQ